MLVKENLLFVAVAVHNRLSYFILNENTCACFEMALKICQSSPFAADLTRSLSHPHPYRPVTEG